MSISSLEDLPRLLAVPENDRIFELPSTLSLPLLLVTSPGSYGESEVLA